MNGADAAMNGRQHGVRCSNAEAHSTVWRGVGTGRGRCMACQIRDDLATRSGSRPATEEQLAAIAGSLTRPALECLVASGEVKAVTVTYGFVATVPAPVMTPEIRAAKEAARARAAEDARRLELARRAAANTPQHEPFHPPRPKPTPVAPPPPPSWEPKPPRALGPRDDGWYDQEVAPGLTRREQWRQRTEAQREAQRAAQHERREEVRAQARENAR
jgi:hypothetical protein